MSDSPPRRRRRDQSQSEAEEDNLLDERISSDSEALGEDLEATAERDYRPIPELDAYESEGIDHEEYSDLDVDERLKAEQEMAQRDFAATRGRGPAALEAEEFAHDMNYALLSRHRALQRTIVSGFEDLTLDADYEELALDFEDPKGKLSEWINQEHTCRWIKRNFKRFLLHFKDENDVEVYQQKVTDMCAENRQSLEVRYSDIQNDNPTIALWIADEPQVILPILNEIAFEIVLGLFPDFRSIFQEIFVRIRDLPIGDLLRNLRYNHLNKLVKVTGVVTRRTGVFPQLKVMVFYCTKCGEKKGPIFQTFHHKVNIGVCGSCQSKGPFVLSQEETIYRNYQKITLQEPPGSVPPGRVPRHKEVILLADLKDSARPGEEVEVTGIYTHMFDYSLNVKHGFPVFSTIVEANFIRRQSEGELTTLTEEEKADIHDLAGDPQIGRIIVDGIAPSIYGHKFIKTALALAMVGGMPKDVGGRHKIRGDINILILGDPGVAKSQFLKYILHTAPRCVYTTGKGASAVGLTAGVHKDPITKEWTLEGGALVLADRGLCLIDEFDKMNDHDRTSIHEAMEQQTISISKAGIVATLQARCSVVAVANPVRGRYDQTRTFAENVDLSDPILSRFDVLCVVKDDVDMVQDHSLATFVLNSHIRSHPEADLDGLLQDSFQPRNITPAVSQEMLKKYILYAKQYVNPRLTDIDKEKLVKFYAELRLESQKSGGVAITVRHIESLLRLAEANARLHLREYVREEDTDLAISLMLESFLQTQKHAVARHLGRRFRHYLRKANEDHELLFHILNKLFRDTLRMEQYRSQVDYSTALSLGETRVQVSIDQFENEASNYGIFDLSLFFSSPLFRDNFTLNERSIIKKTY